MLLEREQLEPMTVKELLRLSYEMGCVIDNPTAGKEVIINELMVHSAKEPTPEPTETPITEAKEPKADNCTIEQVKAALVPYTLRGMKLYHNAEDNTWLIRVKLRSMRVRDSLTGDEQVLERWRDDSGTMNQPIEVIKRCARVLMQGAPNPEAAKPQAKVFENYASVA